MKDLLPGFHRPTDEEFRWIWGDCIFIVDTNVILNLYRYPATAREELLKLLTAISSRIWIPFHVALEYQRNRPSVIAEQKQRFDEVKHIVSKVVPQLEENFARLQLHKRHSLISVDALLHEIRAPIEKFIQKLADMENGQIEVHNHDSLRERIEKIFSGRIGPLPDEAWMSRVNADAKMRFEKKLPPGFADEKKGDKGKRNFNYGGITYDEEIGDIIIWNQILDFSRKTARKSIIFVTDDTKADWWWSIHSKGEKKLGPRPELVEEIKRAGGISEFYMYSSEQFLQFSRNYIDEDVSQEALNQVREFPKGDEYDVNAQLSYFELRGIVKEWLKEAFSDWNIQETDDLMIEFFLTRDDIEEKFGICFINHGALEDLESRINKQADMIEKYSLEPGISKVLIIIVHTESQPIATRIYRDMRANIVKSHPRMVINFGYVLRNDTMDVAPQLVLYPIM